MNISRRNWLSEALVVGAGVALTSFVAYLADEKINPKPWLTDEQLKKFSELSDEEFRKQFMEIEVQPEIRKRAENLMDLAKMVFEGDAAKTSPALLHKTWFALSKFCGVTRFHPLSDNKDLWPDYDYGSLYYELATRIENKARTKQSEGSSAALDEIYKDIYETISTAKHGIAYGYKSTLARY